MHIRNVNMLVLKSVGDDDVVQSVPRAHLHDLPPLELLRSFEAAARSLSFTQAAVELSLTQSAVSRQIQQLEASLEDA